MEMDITMGERLKHLRKEKGVTQEKVGKKVGVSKSTIMKYEKGYVQNIKRITISKLADFYGVTPTYLLGMDDLEEESQLVKIPLLGTVKAGFDYLANENHIGDVDMSSKFVSSGKEYFALKIIGNSMYPEFKPDDIVIVHKQPDFENGQIGVVNIGGDEATLKKLYKVEDGLQLISINNEYEPKFYTKREVKKLPVRIAGIVEKLIRDI